MTRMLAAALALAVVALGVQTYRLAAEQREHAETVAKWAQDRESREASARLAVEAARAEEQRRTAEVQKVADEAHEALERARADADAAADAGQRLRDRIAIITAACGRASGHPGAAGAGPAAEATADLLADVQRRLDAAADGIARFADQAHAAGTACERASDAVRQ